MTPARLWLPYCGPGATPGDLLARWNLDPWLLAALAVALFGLMVRVSGRERLFGLGAWIVLALVFVSPLCALSSALFAARTVHHVLLVAVAAPLAAWALPKRGVGPLALATAVQAAVFWTCHAPDAYALAMSDDGAYWLMQASLFASALWFWMAVRRASALGAVAALLAAMVAMGLLGAVITFAEAPLYGPHLLTTAAWALTPLGDQQAAGLIMWAPAAAIYLFAALATLGRWIGPDRAAMRSA